jgi:translation initiation factor IF-1
MVAKEGIALESLPNLMFRVKIKDTEQIIIAHMSGKMKLNKIRVLPGDRVYVEVSDDGEKGRIIRRL